jgi:high affinity Mn2+ porin
MWNRPDDVVGFGAVLSGLSRQNQKFLQAGGLGIELGDGALNYGPETALEMYYSIKIWKSVQGTLDYQFMSSPGANQDRGPVSIFGVRLHEEM